MAWTEKLASGRYRGGYRIPDGAKRYTGDTFVHKTAAQREAARLEAESRDLGWRDPRAAARTWGAWCDEWQKSRLTENSTAAREVGVIEKHVRPKWGEVALIDITRHDVKVWAVELQEAGLAPATVKKLCALLSVSLNGAIDAGILTANPASRLNLGAPDNLIERYLTKKEQRRFLAALPEGSTDRALASVLLGCGLRWGEAVALRRGQLDMKGAKLRVRDSWDTRNRVMKPYPKGKKRRSVPLPTWVADAVKAACPKDPHALLFSVDGEHPIDLSNWRRFVFTPALEKAKIEPFRIHDLRHTYASNLIQAGLPIERVRLLLGHVSIITTQRYAHLGKLDDKEVLEALVDPSRAKKKPKAEKRPGAKRREEVRGAKLGHSSVAIDREPLNTSPSNVIDGPWKSQIRA
ncbi:tyrosine-type recombinase/integrase [Leucobacter sp. NPDC058333]|uniref:tyrosine-type recombinase/integrase n=1 Tax=Leucobacter sp. NPDC058333 TaxID=3346450 RepID=UPI0036633143